MNITPIQASYDPGLVALSYLVAVAASIAALELSGRIATSVGRRAYYWLGAGGCAMGFGIWTMHFVGMLAYEMRMPYAYDVPITILSLVFGIVASVFALWVASRSTATLVKIGVSGILLGAGIAAMHYTGMAAMQMQAVISYDAVLVGASILVGILAATAAIWIIFTLIHYEENAPYLLQLKIIAAMTMGLAICGMHYTGMAAVRIEPLPNAYMFNEAQSNPAMAMTLAIAALVILGITHLTLVFDVRVAAEQRRGTEAEQQASALSELLDESLNEIYVLDLETFRVVNVNKGACEHLGYPREQLKTMTPLDFQPKLTRERLQKVMDKLAREDCGVSVFEGTHQRADGSTYPVQINLQRSELLGRPVALAIVSDISQRKVLEEQLMQARKLESIGRLAAGIAHEINTPAQYVGDNTRFLKDAMDEAMQLVNSFLDLHKASVSGTVTPQMVEDAGELIETIDPDYLAEEVPVAIDQTLDGINRITMIVRAMKEFSHPGSKSQELVDLNRTIENTITVASNEWKYVAEMVTDFDSSLPAIPCMPQEISQVVLNLIVNAAHAIDSKLEPGSTDKGIISVSTSASNGFAEIRITDSGSGIPEAVRDRIFDPFFTTKEVGKGTGQGLSMAYSTIVKGHGGNLSFETEDGAGTTFLIKLPIAGNPESAVGEVA